MGTEGAAEGLPAYLERYSKGEFAADPYAIPPQPSALFESDDDSSIASGSVASEDNEVSQAKRLFKIIGFAAPKPGSDTERLQVMSSMGLLDAKASDTVKRALRLAMRVVPKDSHVFLSLVGKDSQRVILGPEEGPLRTGVETTRDISFCGHTILSESGMDVPDATKDWRFQNSPLVRDGTIGAYSGIPMRVRRLSQDSSSSSASNDEHAVGAFCVYSATARKGRFIDGETREVLEDLARIVAREFEAQGYQKRQTIEAKMRESAAMLLEKSATRTQSSRDLSNDFYGELVRAVGDVLECTTCAILDMRGFSLTSADQLQSTLSLLGLYSRDSSLEQIQSIFRQDAPENVEALVAYLQTHRGAQVYQNRQEALQSVWAPWMAQRPNITAFFALPLYAPDGELQLLMTASHASQEHAIFGDADCVFMTALGKIALQEVLRDRLLQADAAKTAFVARISHELRTPVHGLLSQIGLIRDSCQPGTLEPIEHHLDTADVCAQMLRDIVEDLLDFGKISATTAMDPESIVSQKKEVQQVDLERLLRDLIAITLLRKRKLDAVTADEEDDELANEVETTLEVQNLPKGGWLAALDQAGFKRVLLNLLSNAVKFTDKGSVRISMRLVEGGTAVEVVVADSGCGMSPQFLRDGIFRPFSQERSFSQGTGLGLSICQGIVQRMSGTLRINSKLGQGTSVWLQLPIVLKNQSSAPLPATMSKFLMTPPPPSRRVEAQAPAPTPMSLKRPEISVAPASPAPAKRSPSRPVSRGGLNGTSNGPMDKSKLRVLCVDDNVTSRRVLTTVVSRAGVDHRQAVDGMEAFEVFKEYQPHCVLTDVSMPVLDGIGSAQLMRKHEAELGWPRAHIIAVSAHPPPTVLDPAVDDWLVKGKLDLQTTRTLINRMQADLLAATLSATSLMTATPDVTPMTSQESLIASPSASLLEQITSSSL